MDLADPSTPLPQWFTEEDLNAYVAPYEKSGFHFPLQMPYRWTAKVSIWMNEWNPLKLCWRCHSASGWKLYRGTGIADPKIEVPVLLIMGEKDYAFKFPGMENYVRSGTLKHFVPDLEIKHIPEGSHFVQEQFPDQVNQLVITFLKNHIWARLGLISAAYSDESIFRSQ